MSNETINVEEELVEERDLRAAAVYIDLGLRELEGNERSVVEATVTDNVRLAIARTLAAFRNQHT